MYKKALESLEKAYSIMSSDPTIAEHLGDVYMKVKELEKSLEMYQKALTLEHKDSGRILKKIEDVEKLLK